VEIVYDALGLLAVSLAVLASPAGGPPCSRRRRCPVALAVAITFVSSGSPSGAGPTSTTSPGCGSTRRRSRCSAVALAATIVLAVVPHLVRPLQRVVRWILLLGLLGGVLVEAAAPSGTLAALLVALVAATSIRLAFGTSAGHPETDDVSRGAPRARRRGRAGSSRPTGSRPGVFVARGSRRRASRCS
jgi:hypothetical protein